MIKENHKIPENNYWKVDLHVHSNYSFDSIIELELLKKRLKSNEVVAITDHNSIKARKKARELGLRFIPGEEVTTPQGHFLVFLNEEQVSSKTLEPFEIIDIAKEMDAVVGIAHPFDSLRATTDVYELVEKVDFIEIYNGKNSEILDKRAVELAEKVGKLSSAGSDSHQLSTLFSCYLKVDEFELEEVTSSSSKFKKFLKKAIPISIRRRSIQETIELKVELLFKNKIK